MFIMRDELILIVFSPRQITTNPSISSVSPAQPMKRSLADADSDSSSICDGCSDSNLAIRDDAIKKIKLEEAEMAKQVELVLFDENLLYEVLRRLEDGISLAKAACVCRQWKQTANDERIWELICTRHYQRSPIQLRAVVSALGGFRQLYSSHLWPLLKPAPSSSSAPPSYFSWRSLPPAPAPPPDSSNRSKARWGKDEVNLSLSLLTINYFKNISNKRRNK